MTPMANNDIGDVGVCYLVPQGVLRDRQEPRALGMGHIGPLKGGAWEVMGLGVDRRDIGQRTSK